MKKYINSVNYNIHYIFMFEFIFKLITLFIGLPLFKVFVNFIKSTYNLKFLSVYSLKILFGYVSFYFIVLGILILIGLYFIFDYSVITLLIHSGLDKNKVNYKDIIKKSLIKTISVFKPKNILYLCIPCLFLFFFNFGLIVIIYNYTDYLRVLVNYLNNNIISLIICIILIVVLLYLFIRCLFIYNEYILKDFSFIKSFMSFNYKHNFKTFIVLILRKIASFIILLILANLIPYLFFHFRELIDSTLMSSIISGLLIFILLYSFFYYSIKNEINDVLYISCSYYYYNNEKVSIVNDINPISKVCRYVRYGCYLIFVIFFTVIMYKVNNKDIKYDFIFDYHIDITAHRGASAMAPENTMAAFKKANEIGVDYVELDVHETKDGYIYVMHDGSLARTLKVNKLDYKVTWDEIKDLNVISKFSEYSNEKVPLLEDVIKWAKDNNVRLNIELKPSSKSVNLERVVVSLINKYGIFDKCVVASFDLQSILKVRELDNRINIVYLGYDLKYVEDIDTFSVNYTSITRDLVKYLHKNNKKIYAWTVEDEDVVKSLINMGVDNIIANDPQMVKDVVNNYKNKNKTNLLLNFLIYLYK